MENQVTTLHFLGGMQGSVPHRLLLGCPYRGAAALYAVTGLAQLEESRSIWHLPQECCILVHAGQTPILSATGSPVQTTVLLAEGGILSETSGPMVLTPTGAYKPAALLAELLQRLPCAEESQLLRSFLSQLLTQTQTLLPDSSLPPASIQLLRQILDTRYAEKLTLDSLSKELHWNKYKLDKDFKYYYNCSPFEYLLNVRVEEACRLLRSTSRSVLDIGFAVGVENTSYFIRLFKGRMGMSPLAYRLRFAQTQAANLNEKEVP